MDPSAPHAAPTVLLLGGTGRTGGRVLQQLLGRGVHVRALVRSAERLPAGVAGDPLLTVVETDLLSLSDELVKEQVAGCDVVISCLGHTISARGVFGKPRDLVTRSVERVCRAARDLRPAQPVRLILMSTVSVNRPGKADTRRGWLERAALWLLRGLVPPARDNQRAADFLHDVVDAADRTAEWVVVRPDTLRDGDVTNYVLHEGLVTSLSHPGETNRANVAYFMCELATDAEAWAAWRGKLPVIVNATPE
ncbi:MAG TPA: NAD(P)-binding oxidoreductase [Thermoleophilia bacterium]|nr:NAD(P)-binding oxidoreductase [Thermoleophilia bacterium]